MAYIQPIIRAALIDMDGTLYDSMPSHARAWQQMCSEIGITIPYEKFFSYEGMTGAATIAMLIREHLGRETTPEEQTRLYARKSELFSAMPTVPVMPGAKALIEEMKQMGIERVLVTGSGQKSLIDRLMRDFPGGFSEKLMVTSHDVARGKPDPEPYLMAMQRAGGLKPEECIVVENAPLGILSGSRSGAYTVAVATGPIPPDELRDAGADIVYDSMEAFAKDFRNLAADLHNHRAM